MKAVSAGLVGTAITATAKGNTGETDRTEAAVCGSPDIQEEPSSC